MEVDGSGVKNRGNIMCLHCTWVQCAINHHSPTLLETLYLSSGNLPQVAPSSPCMLTTREMQRTCRRVDSASAATCNPTLDGVRITCAAS